MFEFTHLVPNLEWFQHYGKAFLSLKENVSWALNSCFPVTRDWVTSKGLKWFPWGSSCHCPFKRSALDQFRPYSWWFMLQFNDLLLYDVLVFQPDGNELHSLKEEVCLFWTTSWCFWNCCSLHGYMQRGLGHLDGSKMVYMGFILPFNIQ